MPFVFFFFFFQAEDGIRDSSVTGVQTCALPISQAERAMQFGFKELTVKLLPPLNAALARVTLMRRTVGEGFGLVADSNGAFDYVESVQLARGVAELGYLWLEEPMDPSDLGGLVQLNKHGFMPLAAGESEFGPRGAIGLAMAGAIGVLQPDCGRVGGITGFAGAVTAAATLGVPVAPPHPAVPPPPSPHALLPPAHPPPSR